MFHSVVDTALETATRDLVEVFVDGGDTADTTTLGQAGTQHLAENKAKAGLSVELLETATFPYGGPDGFKVGDKLPLEVGPGITITDVLREVALNWDGDNGLELRQQIGTPNDGPLSEMAKILASVNRGIRKLSGR